VLIWVDQQLYNYTYTLLGKNSIVLFRADEVDQKGWKNAYVSFCPMGLYLFFMVALEEIP